MTLDNANDTIFDFCQSLGGNAIVFGPGPSDSKTQTQQDNFIAVTAKFEGGANCPPPLNFMDVIQVDANVQTCQDRLGSRLIIVSFVSLMGLGFGSANLVD